MKKLWPYLLLNVIVSAVTVTLVLIIWNASHPCLNPGSATAANGTGLVGNSQPTASLPPLAEKLFEVQSVIGSGDLQNEHVHLLYLGSNQLNMLGWTIFAGKKEVYTFPAFVLFKGGALDLYTRAGANSAIELYLNSKDAVWASGVKLTLRDPQGNTRLEYLVP
jgi:hypothetical protein